MTAMRSAALSAVDGSPDSAAISGAHTCLIGRMSRMVEIVSDDALSPIGFCASRDLRRDDARPRAASHNGDQGRG